MFRLVTTCNHDKWINGEGGNAKIFLKNLLNDDFFDLVLRLSRKKIIKFKSLATGGKNCFADLKNHTILINLSLVSTGEIATLNKQYRGKDGGTNVLSFPYLDFEGKNFYLGDIFLCYEKLLEEANAQQKPFNHHLTHLILHGILHLLGYDHINDKDAVIMERLEARILKQYCIDNPYL